MNCGERWPGRKPGASPKALIDLTSLPAQVLLGLRGDNLGTLFCTLFGGNFGCPAWAGQAVMNHGTFCSVSLDDLHMCSWTIIQKPPGESRSLGPLGKLLGIYLLQHFSVFPFPLLPRQWQRLPHFTNEKSWLLWLKAGISREGADSLWNCLLSIRAPRPRLFLILCKYYCLSRIGGMLLSTRFSSGDVFMVTPAAR